VCVDLSTISNIIIKPERSHLLPACVPRLCVTWPDEIDI
jgi:hypothetical protein